MRTREEATAKDTLSALERMDPSTDAFLQSFIAFRRDVEAHAEAEETTILPLVSTLGAKDRESMARAFLLAEKMAPTHAHSGAPTSAAGNMLVGPFVAMVDRVRDAIRDVRQN